MTIAHEILDCRPEHLLALAPMLRQADALEVQAIGLDAKKALWRSYRASHTRRTYIIGGEIAVIGGCSAPSLLSREGHPWLLTSQAVEQAPLAFVRQARLELRRVLEIHPILSNWVDSRYHRAIGFLEVLGFTVGRETMRTGPDKIEFLKFEIAR